MRGLWVARREELFVSVVEGLALLKASLARGNGWEKGAPKSLWVWEDPEAVAVAVG